MSKFSVVSMVDNDNFVVQIETMVQTNKNFDVSMIDEVHETMTNETNVFDRPNVVEEEEFRRQVVRPLEKLVEVAEVEVERHTSLLACTTDKTQLLLLKVLNRSLVVEKENEA